MLRTKASMTYSRGYKGDTNLTLRTMFVIGDSFLFAGDLKQDTATNKAEIQFKAIDWTVYRALRNMVAAGKKMGVMLGGKLIGEAEILQSSFEN